MLKSTCSNYPNHEEYNGYGCVNMRKLIDYKSNVCLHNLSDAYLSKKLFIYSGKSNKLTVKINDNVLKENRDYYISNSINKKAVGEYDLKICGIGNYQGKKTLHYTIIPKKVKIKKIVTSKKKTQIYWSANQKEYDGFVLEYAYDNNFNKKSKKCVISNKIKAFTISNLKNGSVVYCRIRGYKIVKKKKYIQNGLKRKHLLYNVLL